MPWEAVLGGASRAAAAVMIVAVLLVRSLAERVVDLVGWRFESALGHANERQRSALAMAAAIDTDLRTRRAAVYSGLWSMTVQRTQDRIRQRSALPARGVRDRVATRDTADPNAPLLLYFFCLPDCGSHGNHIPIHICVACSVHAFIIAFC